MISPEEIKIKKEKESKTEGRFIIEPLPAGYGNTLGNALRRVLLSSLPGAAIAEVSFKGISHPFSTIKGVKEDVIELILNLKKVRFIMHSDEPLEGRIEAKGKKEVTAGDIKIVAGAEVANPKLKIATLTDRSARLSAKLLVERGVGYKTSEERKGSAVGVIPMDSLFSPVTKATYWVEETRLGRETGLDRLILEVITDGTIEPFEALKKASSILIDYFGPIGGEEKVAAKAKAGAKEEKASDEVKRAAVSDLNLPSQTKTILEKSGIKTVGMLIKKSAAELAGIRGFGAKRVSKVEKELEKLGVSLKAEEASKEG